MYVGRKKILSLGEDNKNKKKIQKDPTFPWVIAFKINVRNEMKSELGGARRNLSPTFPVQYLGENARELDSRSENGEL